MNTDLFGDPPQPKVSNGYAGRPGEGPDGETCSSCTYCGLFRYHGKRYYKCTHGKGQITHSERTDIRLKTAACQYWEADDDDD